MKNQVKTIVKGAVFSLFLLAGIGFSNNANAQKYGGSAYVYVKDSESGDTRVLTATTRCDNYDESSAKSDLQHQLKMKKYTREEFDSQVYYSIDRCNDDDKKKYGGSASVRVRDSKSGNTRVLTATTICNNYNKSAAKSDLEHQLIMKTGTWEELIEGISYDIDSCN